MQSQQTKLITLASLALLITLGLITFWPGTSGGFLVDDVHNLTPMSRSGGINDLDSLRQFAFSGGSGPTGRPLSLASFTLDSQTWPTDAYAFKRTNIIFHILNAIIIFFVISKLLTILSLKKSSVITISFLTSIIWLLHPLHTSTVLYVIQRMTELAALFSLIAIWCYLHGRQQFISTANPTSGYIWMSFGVVFIGLLAVLSKESAVLLPLYIVIIEYTLLRQIPRPKNWHYWAIPILGAPIAFLASYLGYIAFDHVTQYAGRDFTLYDRLLTEPRVLLDYLGKIILPVELPSLYHESFVISTSLLTPATTLISITILIAILTLAIYFKNRQPVLCFAALWFLGGHLLESSVIPLEFYFEHRNYLPMLGIIFAAIFYIEKYLSHRKYSLILGAVAIICLESFTTWHYSNIWGNPMALATAWAENNPTSVRAQLEHTTQIINNGSTADALARTTKLYHDFPDNLGVEMLYVSVLCHANQLTKEQLISLFKNLKNTKVSAYNTQNTIIILVDVVIDGSCRQISKPGVLALLDSFLENRQTTSREPTTRMLLHLLKFRVLQSQGNLALARTELEKAFTARPSVDLAIQQALFLINIKSFAAAHAQLDKAEAINKKRSPLLPSRTEEINKVRATITNSSN